MPEDKLIDPAWLVKARKDRKHFACRVVLVFGVLSVLAWWALPMLEGRHADVIKTLAAKKKATSPSVPAPVKILLWMEGWFKALWVAIGIGCAVAILVALTGKIDTLLPVLNIAVLLIGAGAVGLTIYVFYAPTLIQLEGI